MSATTAVGAGDSLVLVKGSDAVLVGDALRGVLAVLVGEGDSSLVVDEVPDERMVGADGEPSIGPLVAAAQTPPFLTDRRVVVGRGLARFGTADSVAALLDYLSDPLSTTALVLVWEKGADQQKAARVPKKLLEAIAAAGGAIVDAEPGKVGAWTREQLRAAPIVFDGPATDLVVEHVGEDAARLGGVIETLVGAHGSGARVGVAEVEPYLLDAGAQPPWALTDAIDRGDVPGALDVLGRSLGAGGRHPLQVMAILANHYGRILALDGADALDERAAAQLLGLKGSTFPARKALEQARRLGHDKTTEFIRLLAAADLDLRGAKAWPPETVLEVLVARLASRTGGGRRRGRR